ncbi:hypothetical protein KY285_016693 [Solanum tuberosum]|nr:hypothetical protein KY285_016693 [Solanum tuberosum]
MLLTSWSGIGSGHSFDAMPLWWHGNRRMGAVFISSLACGRLVHPSTAQPRGSKIASPYGTDIDLRFYKAWSTLCRSLPLTRGAAGFLSFTLKQLEPLLLSVVSVSSFSTCESSFQLAKKEGGKARLSSFFQSEKGKANESKRAGLKGPLRLVNGLASGREWKHGLAGVLLTQS